MIELTNEGEWCFRCDDYRANCFGHSYDDQDDDEDQWECEFPGECIMQGPHTNDECITSELAAEIWEGRSR